MGQKKQPPPPPRPAGEPEGRKAWMGRSPVSQEVLWWPLAGPRGAGRPVQGLGRAEMQRLLPTGRSAPQASCALFKDSLSLAVAFPHFWD